MLEVCLLGRVPWGGAEPYGRAVSEMGKMGCLEPTMGADNRSGVDHLPAGKVGVTEARDRLAPITRAGLTLAKQVRQR